MSRQPKPKPVTAAPEPGGPDFPLPDPKTDAPAPVTPHPVPPQEPVTTGAASAPAPVSAATAAEAAAAPVDPSLEDDHSDRRGPEGYVVVVTGPAKGRWRIGRKFGPEPVTIPAPDLTEPEMRALDDDPELTLKVVEIED